MVGAASAFASKDYQEKKKGRILGFEEKEYLILAWFLKSLKQGSSDPCPAHLYNKVGLTPQGSCEAGVENPYYLPGCNYLSWVSLFPGHGYMCPS